MYLRLDSPGLTDQKKQSLKTLKSFRDELEKQFHITDPRLQAALLYSRNVSELIQHKKQESQGIKTTDSIDVIINHALRGEGILLKEAEDTTTSKEFWESYFAKNPAKKPSKIVYYKGTDPTSVLKEWKESNEIFSKATRGDMGFPERRTSDNVGQAITQSDLDRFKGLARSVIEKYYAKIST